MLDKAFDWWMTSHKNEIEKMQNFSIEPLPDDIAKLSECLSFAQGYFARCGYLLADIEGHLVHARATETLVAVKKFPEMSVQERKIVVEDRIKDIKRVRDILQITTDALKNRCYVCMNLNRSDARINNKGDA